MTRLWAAHILGVVILVTIGVGIGSGYWTTYAGWGFVGFLIIMLLVGWYLAVRVPWNSLGWLMMGITALFALQVPFELLGRATLPTDPQTSAWLLWFGHDRTDLDTWWWMLPVGLMLTQIPLRYPSGHLLSPRWRWFSRSSVAALLAATAILSTATETAYPGVASPAHLDWHFGSIPAQYVVAGSLFSAAVLGSVASTVVRYARGNPEVRAQIRWIFWAVALNTVAMILAAFAPPDLEILHQWILLAHAIVPVSMLIAILRFHLYEIDRIISRTTAYGVLTVLVAGVYALVVTSVTALLPQLPAVAVAVATLSAAAAFLPALRGVRRALDRHFDRERYNAERVVDAFGERLRTEVDPAATAPELVDAVERALAPTRVGLWIRRPVL